MDEIFAKYRVIVSRDVTIFGAEFALLVQQEIVEPDETYWWTLERYALNVPTLWFKSTDDRLEIVVRKAVSLVLKREGVKATQAELTAKASEMFAKMIAEATKDDK